MQAEMVSRRALRPLVRFMLAAVGAAGLTCAAAALAQEVVDTHGKPPTPDEIRQGLFPEEDCEQLKAAGFKCMGFKPAVRFSLPAVAFRVGSADLPEGVRKQLDGFAEVLRQRQPGAGQIRVEGHADKTGDDRANLELSQKRADSAKAYLVAKGVNPDLIVTVGLGSSELVNVSNPAAAENRRVVIGRDTATH